ncbi:MAG: hypothetical protein ACK40L_07045 [Hydrogenophaga sp.]
MGSFYEFFAGGGMARAGLADGSLVELVPDAPLDVPLYWHTARAAVGVLGGLTRAVRAAARTALLPLAP